MELSHKDATQNVYAYNSKFEEIHISQAESGRKGYLCLGCQREMQAVVNTKPNRISYFRHDHNASKGYPQCSYSDETYRHKLAKVILLKTKRVKVPALYKYPPNGIVGNANLLSESKYICAHSVEPELYFYEDESGIVHWDKNQFVTKNQNLLFKPDVVFFDEHKKPILLIEVIATHKLTEQKILGLKRLGIDTIQITIPKDSPQAIENIFETTSRTKWIYNYEQEITEYFPVPDSSTHGIFSIDEIQREFFEESFKCRTTQINNLIRTVRKCLESQQYRAIADAVESELSRVKINTEEQRESLEQLRDRNRRRIDELREGIRDRITAKYRDRRDRIEGERKSIEEAEKAFNKYYIEENNRYDAEQSSDRTRIENSIFEEFRSETEAVEREENELEERYNRKRTELENSEGVTRQEIERIRELHSSVEQDIGREQEIIKGYEEEKGRIERETANHEQAEITNRFYFEEQQRYGGKLEEKYRGIRFEREERYTKEGSSIEHRFNEVYRDLKMAIERRCFEGDGYTRDFQSVLADLDKVPDFIIARKSLDRYGKALKCFKEGAYKNWHD